MSHKGHSKPCPVKLIKEISARTRSIYIHNHKDILVQTEEKRKKFQGWTLKSKPFFGSKNRGSLKPIFRQKQFLNFSHSWGSEAPSSFSNAKWQGNFGKVFGLLCL